MAKNPLALLLFIAFLFLSLDLRAEDSNQIIQNQKQLDDKLEVDREFLEDVEEEDQKELEVEMEHLITLAGEFYDREMERYEKA